MVQATRVKVEGAAELQETLISLGEEVATKIGIVANRAAATELADALRVSAPYSNRASTVKYYKPKGAKTNGKATRKTDYGHLRDAIKVRKVTARQERTIVHYVGTAPAFWGQFLEFGTRYMAARKWVKPVFDRLAGNLIVTQSRELGKGIERATKRMARLAKKAGGG